MSKYKYCRYVQFWGKGLILVLWVFAFSATLHLCSTRCVLFLLHFIYQTVQSILTPPQKVKYCLCLSKTTSFSTLSQCLSFENVLMGKFWWTMAIFTCNLTHLDFECRTFTYIWIFFFPICCHFSSSCRVRILFSPTTSRQSVNQGVTASCLDKGEKERDTNEQKQAVLEVLMNLLGH